jgi:CheY-like chemotaxis protein
VNVSGATVLLVDDNPDHLILMRRRLSEAGFNIVAEALTPDQASSLAQHHSPDAVVMDLWLSGTEPSDVVAMIKQASPSSRIAVVSASPMRSKETILADTRADAFVEKAEMDELVLELNRLTGGEA